MEFLVIVLFVVAIVVVNFVITRAQRRKKQAEGETVLDGGDRPERAAKPQRTPRRNVSGAAGASPAPRTSAAAAREANARLDATQHQLVYAAIAQGHPVKAVKLYAQFTGVGVRAAGAAVENLAMHPQPYQQPRPAGAAPATPTPADATPTPASSASATPAPADSTPAESTPADAAPAASTPAGPETRKPADDAAGSTPKAKAAEPENPTADNSAAGKAIPGSGAARAADSRGESAAKPPAAPEEDEISRWVKDLRPEDF